MEGGMTMTCQDIQQKLLQGIDPTTFDHIATCAACQEFQQTLNTLEHLSPRRVTAPDALTFAKVMQTDPPAQLPWKHLSALAASLLLVWTLAPVYLGQQPVSSQIVLQNDALQNQAIVQTIATLEEEFAYYESSWNFDSSTVNTELESLNDDFTNFLMEV
jgi:hypothetical protein